MHDYDPPLSPAEQEQLQEGDLTHKERFGYCEDAPCCGCCGPGSDDPAYAYPDDPMDMYDDPWL